MATPMTKSRRFAFSSLLFAAMGAATFMTSSLGILATFIIDDLSISRADLGVVLAVANVAAATLSPVVAGGRFAGLRSRQLASVCVCVCVCV